MINLDTIEKEIHDLEARGDTTYSQCERLAWLYIVKDHLTPKTENIKVPYMSGSEFLDSVSGLDYAKLLGLLNEYFETIKVLYPKSYDSFMERLRALRY